MIANEMHIEPEDSQSLIAASLLYDFGYLSVPKSILDKNEDLSASDRDLIQLKSEHGYEIIRPHFAELGLNDTSLEIIQNIIFEDHATISPRLPKPPVQLLIDILKAADKFDRLTAMNINHAPMSELAAMTFLQPHLRI